MKNQVLQNLIFYIFICAFTYSLDNFINLCFLGMLDFKHNISIKIFYLVTAIITYIIMIIKFIKDKKKNITYYYFFISILIIYPLIDMYHTAYYYLIFLVVYLYNSKFACLYTQNLEI